MTSRWVAFDPATASELRSQMPHAAVFDAPGRTTVEYAVSASVSVVVVLPAALEGRPLIAVFRPQPSETVPLEELRPTRPRGILGLSEEFAPDEEIPWEAKPWWRKFFHRE